jgi:hypothetical protein
LVITTCPVQHILKMIPGTIKMAVAMIFEYIKSDNCKADILPFTIIKIHLPYTHHNDRAFL